MPGEKSCPMVFGHRGASVDAPENTLAAFRLAEVSGADGIELDVRLSADGEAVVFHDDLLGRTTNSSVLFPERDLSVRECTLQDLKLLDGGRWFAPGFSGERIPSLAEVFEEFGGRFLIHVEMKWGNLLSGRLESEVSRLVVKYGLLESIYVMSFNHMYLSRIRKLNPRIKIGIAHRSEETRYPRDLRRHLPSLELSALYPNNALVDAQYVEQAAEMGLPVFTGVVDEVLEMRRLCALGVDGVITNNPTAMLDALGRGVH